MQVTFFYLLIVGAYLLGSLSSAVIVCKLLHLPDPREQGSGNPGATNVLRLGGKGPAIIVLLADVLKGAIPVLSARLLGLEGLALGIVAGAAVLGHMFPVFFHFKGGKGVATGFGGVLALSFWLAIVILLTWLIVAAITRYSSLAAIVAVCMTPIYNIWFGNTHYTMALIGISLVILIRHHQNIRRLIDGTESKIGKK